MVVIMVTYSVALLAVVHFREKAEEDKMLESQKSGTWEGKNWTTYYGDSITRGEGVSFQDTNDATHPIH